PEAGGGDVDRCPRTARANHSGALARQIDSRSTPEAEIADRRVQPVGTEAVSDLGTADVARIGDHVGKGEKVIAVMIVDRPATDAIRAALAVDDFLRCYSSVAECGGGE